MNKQTKRGRTELTNSRRQFLKLGTCAGALAVTGPVLRGSTEVAHVAYQAKPFEFEEATVSDLQNAMQSGRHTARAIAESYLARIAELDKHGPTVNSVIELNPDALATADALDRNPCGSSSGSGAAASANFAAIAVGTETDGSVVCPSSTCGLVGIKPTLGLVSRVGIIPIAHSQDTAGPMARTVTDATILLGALTGIDARDAATGDSRGHALADYTKFLD